MGLLSNADKEKIKRAVPKSSNKIIDVTVARLYVAYPNPNEWQYTGLSGAIVLVDDIVGNTFFLKLVDIEGHRGVLWDQELYVGFEYNQDRTFFHSFELEECYAGLLFEDISEAGHFMKRVQRREKYGSKKTLSNKNAIALSKKLEEEKASQVVHGPRGEPLIADQRRRYGYNNGETDVNSIPSMSKKAPPPPPPVEASAPENPIIPPEAPPVVRKHALPPVQPPAVNQLPPIGNVSRMSSVRQTSSMHTELSEPSDSLQDDDTTSSEDFSDQKPATADFTSNHDKEERRPKYQLPPPPAEFFPLQPPAPAPAPTSDMPTISNVPRLPERTLPAVNSNVHPVPPIRNVHPVPPANHIPPAPPAIETTYTAPIPSQQPGSVPAPSLPERQPLAAFPPPPPRPQPSIPSPPANSARVPPPPPARRGTGPPPPPRRGGPSSSLPRNTPANTTGMIPPAPPRRAGAPPPPPRAARSAALPATLSHVVNPPPPQRIPATFSQPVPQQTYQPPPPPPPPAAQSVAAPPPPHSMQMNYTNSVAGTTTAAAAAPPPPPPPPPSFTSPHEPPKTTQQSNTMVEKTGDASRDALLASIRGAGGIGALRKIDKSQLDKPSVLLQEAHGDKSTKAGSSGAPVGGGATAPGGSLADAIAAALDKRKNKVRQGADDQENGDDW